MQFIPANRDDIARYYRNTFIKLKDFGEMLFHIDGVDSQRVVGKCETGDPFCIYMDDETPYTVEYILPHKSFFQLDGDAVQLQRIPAKQYYRGLCSSNVQLQYMKADGTLKVKELNFDTLKKFVTKAPFLGMRAALSADHVSTALSPRMMYFRQRREICIDFTPIAKVNPGKLQITVHKAIFLSEVQEMLAAHEENNIFKAELYVPQPRGEKTKTEDLLKEMGEPVFRKSRKSAMYQPMPVPGANWLDDLVPEQNVAGDVE